MPRYKYSCPTCGFDDVKQINYKFVGLIKTAICPECDENLEKKFIKPPRNWFNQQRTRN